MYWKPNRNQVNVTLATQKKKEHCLHLKTLSMILCLWSCQVILTLNTAALWSSPTSNLLIFIKSGDPETHLVPQVSAKMCVWGKKDDCLSSSGIVSTMVSRLLPLMSEMSTWCPQAADLDARPSPLLVLVDHLAAQRDGLQVIQGLLLAAASLTLHLGQRVHHGHVHVQVVGLLKTLLAYLARKLQVGLCLVLGHVVF